MPKHRALIDLRGPGLRHDFKPYANNELQKKKKKKNSASDNNLLEPIIKSGFQSTVTCTVLQ